MKKVIITLFILISLGCILISNQSEKHAPVPLPEDFGRSEWRMMMRGGKLASEDQMKNVRSYFVKKNGNEKDGGIAFWEELGPKNKSGRMRSVTLHPDNPTIYVGAVSGGIWKSVNAGFNWTPLNEGLPNLAITSIIIHPTQPDTMYVATGEGITGDIPGNGIYRSYNGGTTWTKVTGSNSINFRWVNKIKFDPNDPSIIWAATGSSKGVSNVPGKLYKIRNNGDLGPEEEVSLNFQGLGIAVTNFWFAPNGDMFAAVSSRAYNNGNSCFNSNGGLAKKSSGANSWTTVNASAGFDANPNRVEIAISLTDPTVIYALCQGKVCKGGRNECNTLDCNDGSSGELYKSTNSGISWTNMNLAIPVFETDSGNNQGAYDNAIWVDPTDEDIVYIGGIDVWSSENGGISFTQRSDWREFSNGTSAHADHHDLTEARNFTSTNKSIYSANDGGLARYNLEQESWTILNGQDMGTLQFYNADFSYSGSRIIGGTQDNGVFLSTNNASTWTELIGGDGGYCALGGGDRLYFSTQRGHFYRSLDNGVTSIGILGLNGKLPSGGGVDPSCLPTAIMEKPAFIAPFAVEIQNNTDHLFACSNNLWYSADMGCSWTVQLPHPVDSSNTYTAIETYQLNNEIYVLVGDKKGGVWRAQVTTGLWSWFELIGQGSIHDRVVTDIAVSPHDQNDIIVAFGGTIDDNIYMQQGQGWTEISQDIPALQVNTVAWNKYDEDFIYIGTDIGILASDNKGQNWNTHPLYEESEGPVFTEITNLVFSDRLHASTYGRGTWRSNYAHKDMYVDKNVQTAYRIGSFNNPFQSIEKAASESGNGTTIHFISEDQHNQISNTLLIQNKRVTLKALNGTVVVE